MGYVPSHMYIVTRDERYKEDFDKEQRRSVIGIAVTGGICFLALIGAGIYSCLFILGG